MEQIQVFLIGFAWMSEKNEKKNPGNEKEHTSFYFPQG